MPHQAPQNLHKQNEHNENADQHKDVTPAANAADKKHGVTSSYSAATIHPSPDNVVNAKGGKPAGEENY